MAREAAFRGILEDEGTVEYDEITPHFIELFRAVAQTEQPALVRYKGQWLTCLVPADHYIEFDAFCAEHDGREPVDFQRGLMDASELLAVGPDRDAAAEFNFAAKQTLEGKIGFFSVDDPGIPEVVISGTDIIGHLAAYGRMRFDLEATRRIEESEGDRSFMVPLPEELFEGVELPVLPDGTKRVPLGHIGFVAEYERLKDEAAADETGRKQADLEALIAEVRGVMSGEVQGEPFERVH